MAYDLGFEEYKAMVKQLFPMVNIYLLKVLATTGSDSAAINHVIALAIEDAPPPKQRMLLLQKHKVASIYLFALMQKLA